MSEAKRGSPEAPTGGPDSARGDSERREGERLLACFPAYVERADGKAQASLIRDLSTTGALLLVRSKLELGDRVKLQLFLSEDAEEPRPASGCVVRIEPLADDEVALWSRRVAVRFDEPLTMVEAEILALEERVKRLARV